MPKIVFILFLHLLLCNTSVIIHANRMLAADVQDYDGTPFLKTWTLSDAAPDNTFLIITRVWLFDITQIDFAVALQSSETGLDVNFSSNHNIKVIYQCVSFTTPYALMKTHTIQLSPQN